MTYVQKIYLYIMSWLQDLYLCIVLLLLMSTDNLCGAQFPAVCTNPSNFHEQICCPEPFASAGPCGSHLKPPRGECIKINTSQTTIDVRGNWPHYYSQICKCRPRFGNFDCGECAFGFKGTSCNEKVIRTRRFLNLMSESETNDLIKTLYMAKTFPSRYVVILKETRPGIVPPMRAASIHDVFVWNHYYISKESYVYDFGHGGPGFPVWHRYYLMWYEREIRWMLGGNKEFAIPFWDWTAESNRMHPFKEELFGASDEKGNVIGNFANWTVICEVDLDHICDPTQTTSRMMRFGTPEVYVANYTKWPTREQVCEAISIPVYDIPPYDPTSISLRSFRNFMEGFYFRGDSEDAKECVESNVECSSDEIMKRQLHNEIHNMIDGTITNVPTASNDPLFILHHAFVDYILEMWIRRNHGEFLPPPGSISAEKGHNYNDVIVPFLPLIECHELLVDSRKLGWTYESLNGLDLESKSCVEYKSGNNSAVLYPESSQIQLQSLATANHPNDNDQTSVRREQQKSILDTDSQVQNALKNNFFTVTSKLYSLSPQEETEGIHHQHFTPVYVCTFRSEKLVFQVPPNCNEVVFQSNLILPKTLTPLGWYRCFPQQDQSGKTPVQSNFKINPNTLYTCNLIM